MLRWVLQALQRNPGQPRRGLRAFAFVLVGLVLSGQLAALEHTHLSPSAETCHTCVQALQPGANASLPVLPLPSGNVLWEPAQCPHPTIPSFHTLHNRGPPHSSER